MARHDGASNSALRSHHTGLRGGFAQTRPRVLYVGTALAVIWDLVAFVHLFHLAVPVLGASANLWWWWPWAWLLLALGMAGWTSRNSRPTPWWAWSALGIGVLTVASATDGTALSIWGAMAIAVWPRQGHPWWMALGGLALLHALIQWGLLMTAWHFPTFISLDLLWVIGLGMLVSVRGSNWNATGSPDHPIRRE